MQIAFWSTVHGQVGTTSTAISHGIQMALASPYTVLIAHLHEKKSTLERCFLTPNEHKAGEWQEIGDGGLEGLLRLAKNDRLQKDSIANYATPLLKNGKLDVLTGLLPANKAEHKWIEQVLEVASDNYDIMILDVPSGLEMDFQRRMIEKSDLVVMCLNQNIHVLEGYMKEVFLGQGLKCAKVLVHLGFYEALLKANSRSIQKKLQLDTILKTPYEVSFQEACNQSRVLEYFLRHYSEKTSQEPFFKAVAGNTTNILKTLNLGGI